jgi:hypothetical protein
MTYIKNEFHISNKVMAVDNNTKFVIPNESKDSEIRALARGSLSRGNLPCILCIHHMVKKEQPKYRLFINMCGVNGLFAGCSDSCIAATMSSYIDKNIIRCLECRNVITLDSKIQILHDGHDNGYLYCSAECYDKAPRLTTRCRHIHTFEFISTNRTQFYYGNDPAIRCVRRICKECSIVYPTDGKLHCFVCKFAMEPKGTGPVATIDNGRHFIRKDGTMYLVCGDVCKEKLEYLNDNICQTCGLWGDKRCIKCKVYYCSRECQRTDWPKHKITCTIEKPEKSEKSEK